MNKEDTILIALSAYMINGSTPKPDFFSSVDLDLLFEVASRHHLTALIASALEQSGIKDDRFSQERAKAIRRAFIFETERNTIIRALENARIWYMPLKGSVIKDYYPQIGMRQMSDNDILIDAIRANDVHEIMTDLGYTTTKYDEGHRDDYQKPPVSHIEMHRVLFTEENGEVFHDYYCNVKDRLIKDEGNEYGYHFTNEDFYIYMIAHEYKHYSWGGTGVRSLLDTYVFLKKFQGSLDWEYIKTECGKLEIGEFEEKNRELALAVFTAGSVEGLTQEQEKMLAYFFGSGTYGTRENIISNRVKKSGKIGYVWKRIFPPMKAIEKHFPFFYKYKVLLPFLPFYRLLCNWKKAKSEIRIIGRMR